MIMFENPAAVVQWDRWGLAWTELGFQVSEENIFSWNRCMCVIHMCLLPNTNNRWCWKHIVHVIWRYAQCHLYHSPWKLLHGRWNSCPPSLSWEDSSWNTCGEHGLEEATLMYVSRLSCLALHQCYRFYQEFPSQGNLNFLQLLQRPRLSSSAPHLKLALLMTKELGIITTIAVKMHCSEREEVRALKTLSSTQNPIRGLQ